MKEILRITIKLTITCLVAAFVMGSVFAFTYNAKKHNEHLNERQTMLGLIGYGRHNDAPSDLKLHTIYRYIIEDRGRLFLGYLVPVRKDREESHELLLVTVEGEFVKRLEAPIDPESAIEATARDEVLKRLLEAPKTFSYSDSTIIATVGSGRSAYLLPGRFPGFKTFIKVMLALDPAFNIVGLEIMEHEEDPGLGAEITKECFRNQFVGKPFERLKTLGVVKEPLPDEFRTALEREKWTGASISPEEVDRINKKYRDHDIYALTGATISSKSVTTGVGNMVKKFSYRVQALDRVIAAQKIPVTF